MSLNISKYIHIDFVELKGESNMKAYVLYEPGDGSILERPIPKVRPNEVLVKVQAHRSWKTAEAMGAIGGSQVGEHVLGRHL